MKKASDNPKYYRYVTSGLDKFTTNKIYKIRDSNNLERSHNFIDDIGKPNGCAGHNHINFTPVTEHEWNLQEGIITPVNQENHSQLSIILKKLHVK